MIRSDAAPTEHSALAAPPGFEYAPTVWQGVCVSGITKKFDAAMLEIYKKARSEAGYNATLFLRMLHERGGLSTAKYLINAAKPSDGYTALYELNRLDLTVEAMIVENVTWHELFTADELEKAKRRLAAYEYQPQGRV